MKYNEAFPSDYLKPDDVSGEGEIHIIADVELETFTDPKTKEEDRKPVLSFADTTKKLILNKTNWKSINVCHGPDSELWKGKKIALVLVSVDAFGETKDAIRVDEKATAKA